MKGIKIELDHNSLLLMDEKYIKLPIFLNKLTSETLGAHKLFHFPFDAGVVLSNKPKSWEAESKEVIEN